MNQEKGSHQNMMMLHLDLRLASSRTVENKFLLLISSHSVTFYCSSTNGLKQCLSQRALVKGNKNIQLYPKLRARIPLFTQVEINFGNTGRFLVDYCCQENPKQNLAHKSTGSCVTYGLVTKPEVWLMLMNYNQCLKFFPEWQHLLSWLVWGTGNGERGGREG